jgi:hypothetical protein
MGAILWGGDGTLPHSALKPSCWIPYLSRRAC